MAPTVAASVHVEPPVVKKPAVKKAKPVIKKSPVQVNASPVKTPSAADKMPASVTTSNLPVGENNNPNVKLGPKCKVIGIAGADKTLWIAHLIKKVDNLT